MSKLQVGRHARVNGPAVNRSDDDEEYRGRVMAVEHITQDRKHARLYDMTTPMIHGYESLPLFRAEDLEPIE